MAIHRVSLAFRRYADADLNVFAGNIIGSLADNPAFPDPPVTVADLKDMQTAFRQAMLAAADGGRSATAAKNKARQTLLDALRQNAGYAQIKAGQDLPTLLTSGFETMSKNQLPSQLPIPSIIAVINERSMELLLRVTSVRNARSYQVRMKNGDDTWRPTVDFSQARRIVMKDLTPGTVYTFQVRAVGGSTGYSDWSDPVSHMAI